MIARRRARGFTLLELLLVMAIIVALTSIVLPRILDQLARENLPHSAHAFRSLVSLVRAHAQFDGVRYRIRFPTVRESKTNKSEQPIIEREVDPINDPDVFEPVRDSWAEEETFVGNIRCTFVRLGRPTIARIRDAREGGHAVRDSLREAFEDIDPVRPFLTIEPDGQSEWATFVLTEALPGLDPRELEDAPQIEVITDGETGLAWLQRPFYDDELDLFEEHGWPVVLRQDFLEKRELTRNDVLELREVELHGQNQSAQQREEMHETLNEG